jgi:hypothetical protein
MTRLQSLAQILTEMWRRYEENPVGWGIALRKAEGGYGDIFILSPDGSLWQIKIDSLYNPRPIGLGMKVGGAEESREIIGESTPPYGFRPVTGAQMRRLRENLQRRRPIDGTIRSILSRKPMIPGDIRGSGIVSGPLIYSVHEGCLSDKQRELDLKLRKSLDKLLQRRGIGGMYA